MPAFSTNMRLKFPIVALLLEVITIVLYAVFVVYDHDSGHHGAEKNKTQTNPVALYPSKYLLQVMRDSDKYIYFLK